MSEQMNAPMLPPPSGVSEWFSVWREALTKPSDQTFARLAQSPNAKLTTALLWVFLGSLVNALFASLVQGAIIRQVIAAVCGAPIGAVVSVVAFMIFVGIVQLIAKMFGGRGTFDQLAYATAAIVAPFSLINSVLTLLTAIPFAGLCFGLVSLIAVVYVIALEVMAVKGVNQFGWGQAVGSYFLPFLVVVCCVSIGVIGILRAAGPGINELFNSIQQSLTPVP
jgi:Yip1-like protein